MTPQDYDGDAPAQASLFGGQTNVAMDVNTLEVKAPIDPVIDVLLCHREARKWHLAYALFYRYHRGETHLLALKSDPLVSQVLRWNQAIGRDIHKMHAFVRFKKASDNLYVAWYEPDHFIFKRAARYFTQRFGCMQWFIFGPNEQLAWDGGRLSYQSHKMKKPTLPKDASEDLWLTYYAHIFNPQRVKIKMMKSEMPVRFWKNLPEAALIAPLLKKKI